MKIFSHGDQDSEVKCICPEYPKLTLAGLQFEIHFRDYYLLTGK